MAYRDAHLDARGAALAALVASHGPLMDERLRVCRARDEAAERIDELGRWVAELERSVGRRGVVATVTQWLGRSQTSDLSHEACALRRAQAEHRDKLAELVTRERAIADRLAEVERARDQLAGLRTSRRRALRSSESPLGHEVRRIDAELVAIDARISALDKAMVVADRVERVIGDLRTMEAGTRGLSWARLAARARAAFLIASAGPSDLDRARLRLRDHLVFARSELRVFVAAFEALRLTVKRPARLAHALLVGFAAARLRQPLEHSELIIGLESVAACTVRLVTAVSSELTWTQHRHAALVDQRRALEGRSG